MAFAPPDASTKPLGSLLLPELKVVSAESSRQLEKRFAFLWASAQRLLPLNAVLANQMTASMMQQARAARAQLPQSVLDFICECCGGLLVPIVSADVQVVPQSRHAPANRRLARQQRRAQQQNGSNGLRIVRESLVNIVRVKCHRCKHANDRAGASVVHKAKTNKRAREEEAVVAPDSKRLKAQTGEAEPAKEVKAKYAKPTTNVSPAAPVQLEVAPTSLFAPPPSPPRKLLDGPNRKKKKKTARPDAAVVAVKSTLSSFLQGLHKSSARK